MPIPGAEKAPSQRMTRAQASRAAQDAMLQASAAQAEPPAEPRQDAASPADADPLIFLEASQLRRQFIILFEVSSSARMHSYHLMTYLMIGGNNPFKAWAVEQNATPIENNKRLTSGQRIRFV